MNPFQWLVDESQQKPRWWCRQVAKVICVATAGILVFTERPWSVGDSIGNFMAMLSAGIFVLFSSSDLLCARMAERFYRYWFWGWAAIGLIHITSPSHAANLCATLAAAVFIEFAFCRPPAPPKHRSRRVVRGGA